MNILSTNDEYETPNGTLHMILQHIPKNKTVYDPFYCNGRSGDYIRSLGFNVIHNKEDFFENHHKHKFDIIVSNPPWSKCKQIFETLAKIDMPFALLVPIDRLGRQYFKFREHIQVVIAAGVKFISDGTAKQRPFGWPCVWICYKVGLPKDLMFG